MLYAKGKSFVGVRAPPERTTEVVNGTPHRFLPIRGSNGDTPSSSLRYRKI